jgi:hypothetical protein
MQQAGVGRAPGMVPAACLQAAVWKWTLKHVGTIQRLLCYKNCFDTCRGSFTIDSGPHIIPRCNAGQRCREAATAAHTGDVPPTLSQVTRKRCCCTACTAQLGVHNAAYYTAAGMHSKHRLL